MSVIFAYYLWISFLTIQPIIFLLLFTTIALADDFYWLEHSGLLATEEAVCVQYHMKHAVHWSCSHRQRFIPKAKSDTELAQIQAALNQTKEAQAMINQGDLYYAMDDYLNAEQAYRQVLKLQPTLTMAWIKLAQFYSALNRDKDALQILHNSLEKITDDADIYYETGLIQVRLRFFSEAIISLAKAALLAPENPHYSYVYAIAVNSDQRPGEALNILHKAYQLHPENKAILTALTAINQDNNHNIAALRYAGKLLTLEPDNTALQRLVVQLKSGIEAVKKD